MVVLAGDFAFLHDLTALVGPPGPPPACTVVVADNGGGGIFSFLPQASSVDSSTFETLFGTPMAVDVAAAARGLGVDVDDVAERGEVEEAIAARIGTGGLAVVRVRLASRDVNVALHDELHRLVVSAVDATVSASR